MTLKVNPQHIHAFVPGPYGKIAVCQCGAFQHLNLKPEDVIVEVAR